ncbi:MAG: hypothetical protein GY950_33030 [bacterium]|nr:hypothetical protein [bacterium]
MKPKKINPKFYLNKATIANLSQADLRDVKGAGTGITCNFCNSNISCYIEKCMVDFTDDNDCTTLPTQTRVVTCP